MRAFFEVVVAAAVFIGWFGGIFAFIHHVQRGALRRFRDDVKRTPGIVAVDAGEGLGAQHIVALAPPRRAARAVAYPQGRNANHWNLEVASAFAASARVIVISRKGVDRLRSTEHLLERERATLASETTRNAILAYFAGGDVEELVVRDAKITSRRRLHENTAAEALRALLAFDDVVTALEAAMHALPSPDTSTLAPETGEPVLVRALE